MALIPKRVKNLFVRRSVHERAGMTLLTLEEARRYQWALEESLPPDEAFITKAVVAEAVAPQLFSLTTGDGEDPAFRRITSPQTLRDLNPLMHDRMLQVCYFLRVTTPFGKRIVEIITSYVCGKGIRVTAKDPDVQAVINSFWNDPVNKMDSTLREMVDELTTYGEYCAPIVVNRISGKVRLGYVDPMNIDGIKFGEMTVAGGSEGAPDSGVLVGIPVSVQLRQEVGQSNPVPLQLVRRVEDVNDPDYGKITGQAFYFAINKAKSASRGFSELFSLADWIDVFDQMMFDFADRVRMLNAFLYHYTIEGGNPKELDEFKNKLTKDPPKQGGVQVTNEKIKIEPKTPDLKGADMSAAAQTVKLYGLGGAGLPAFFFADPMDSNRNTAAEMSVPTGKKIQDRQNHLSMCLTEILDLVIDCAVQAGTLRMTVDRSYQIEFPELEAKDLEKGATTLQGVTTSLTVGVQEGWIRKQTAARAFHTVLGEIGVEIEDHQAEYELAQEELATDRNTQQNALFPQSNLDQALQQLQGGQGALPSPGPGKTLSPAEAALLQQSDGTVN